MDSVSFCLLCLWVCAFSRVRLFATPWTAALQALCPWDSPGKDTGVGCRFLLWDLSDPGIEPASLASLALAGGFFTTSAACEVLWNGCLAHLHSHLINTRQISQELLHMRHVDWLQTISLSCLDIPAKINPESQKNGSSQNSLKTLEAGLHAHGFPVPHRHLLDGAAKRTPSKPRPRSSCSQKTLKLTRGISTCWLLCGAVQL